MTNLFRFKLVNFLIIIFTVTISYAQKALDSKYYFVNNEKLLSLEQKKDTLYEYRCNKVFECREKARKHYKIIKSKTEGNLTLYAVEWVNLAASSSKSIIEDRFFIIGIEKLSENKIKVINETTSYTKDAISKLPFGFNLIEDKFGYTYYKENYLKSLNSDFEIDKDFADKIMLSMKTSYFELMKLYKNTKVGDMYGTGIISEVLGREMVKRNLNPISARSKLEKAAK